MLENTQKIVCWVKVYTVVLKKKERFQICQESENPKHSQHTAGSSVPFVMVAICVARSVVFAVFYYSMVDCLDE